MEGTTRLVRIMDLRMARRARSRKVARGPRLRLVVLGDKQEEEDGLL